MQRYIFLKTSVTPRCLGNPLWNKTCKQFVHDRQKAMLELQRLSTPAIKLTQISVLQWQSLHFQQRGLPPGRPSMYAFPIALPLRRSERRYWLSLDGPSFCFPSLYWLISSHLHSVCQCSGSSFLSILLPNIYLIAEPDSTFPLKKLLTEVDGPLDESFSLCELRSLLPKLTLHSSPDADLFHNQFRAHLRAHRAKIPQQCQLTGLSPSSPALLNE